jgi:hypothetical protein
MTTSDSGPLGDTRQDALDLIGPVPDLLPPVNDPGDARMPAHTEQAAHFLVMWEQIMWQRIAFEERRLDKLERALKRERLGLNAIGGGRRI